MIRLLYFTIFLSFLLLIDVAISDQTDLVITTCIPNPCFHLGHCTIENGLAKCTCGQRYVGKHCDFIDPCESKPCILGTCQALEDKDNGFRCICPPNRTGDRCQTYQRNFCDEKRCENGGKCTLLGNRHEGICNCAIGYKGENCTDVDVCAYKDCKHGSKCIETTSSPNGFKCDCLKGYYGDFCQHDNNECYHDTTLCNHGSCENTIGSYKCNCEPGWTGKNCDSSYVSCSAGTECKNAATCVPNANFGFSCRCLPGFEGEFCEINKDNCNSNPCKNSGKCLDTVNGYTCNCPAGWTGPLCTEDIDECQNNPCQNYGTCHNNQGNFMCVCVLGWTGKFCESNVDDCSSGPCQNGGTCVDHVSRFVCTCAEGYVGIVCEHVDPCTHDYCAGDDGVQCHVTPTDGSAKCTCPQGVTGERCETDIDECNDYVAYGQDPNKSLCNNQGTCVNIHASYRCACHVGFTGSNCAMQLRECASDPCSNGGTCMDFEGHFECTCLAGFGGKLCENREDICGSNVLPRCSNGGDCVRDNQGFNICKCAQGYHGTYCSQGSVTCSNPQHSCLNGGTCKRERVGGTDKCVCPLFYTGYRCEVPPDNPCAKQPCLNRGQCIPNLNGGYECKCIDGTDGDRCQVTLDHCKSNPCVGGVCENLPNDYRCRCYSGYKGELCADPIDECVSDPCQNGGTCNNLMDGFSCTCMPGYYGNECTSRQNYCKHNPCGLNGRCDSLVDRFTCKCNTGYLGMMCTDEVNACHSNPCQHGGSCRRTGPGIYQCSCTYGWNGMNCEKNVDICDSKPCRHGVCIDDMDSYRCACEAGFTGRNCDVTLDPCQYHKCVNQATCRPTKDYMDYRCVCQEGYRGTYCEDDVNECDIHTCKNGGSCDNLKGSFACLCPPGYRGHQCEIDIDECQSSPCANSGHCNDLVAKYGCDCRPGFTGPNCEIDIDECKAMPCRNGATCTDMVNSYVCTCLLGFSGINCQNNDQDCSNNTCLNGGTCIDGVHDYTCKCAAGFLGKNCEHRKNHCESNPCLNRGSCVESGSTFACHCQYGYAGDTCEIAIDWCNHAPPMCQNNGRCEQMQHNGSNHFQCICPSHFTGRVCDVPNITCVQRANDLGINVEDVCNGNGACFDISNAHRCECNVGFTGSHCDTDIDECLSNPCQNGAKCENLRNSFKCWCPPGYSGATCGHNVDDCVSSPCRHGGTCIDGVNAFTCVCPVGTLGERCEKNIDECIGAQCYNGGTCQDMISGYTCRCPAGFTGDQCEGDINECLSNPCSVIGTLRCDHQVGNFLCKCKRGYHGNRCENSHNCQFGKYGDVCEYDGSDPCKINPCKGDSLCIPEANEKYKCQCEPNLTGHNCNRTVTSINIDANIEKEKSICQMNDCSSKAKRDNGHCDMECNYFECDYDNSDCSGGRQPFKDCPKARFCASVFNDSKCNPECDNKECLYDDFKCDGGLQTCPPKCNALYGDGSCNEDCKSAVCGFDGGDCEKVKEQLPGDIWLVLLTTPEQFLQKENSFRQVVSEMVRAVVSIKESPDGIKMIGYWNSRDGFIGTYDPNKPNNGRTKRSTSKLVEGTIVWMTIDTAVCKSSSVDECFATMSEIVQIFSMNVAMGNFQKRTGMKAYSLDSELEEDEPKTSMAVIIGVIVLGVVVLLVVMVLLRKRKINAPTWFPEMIMKAPSSGLAPSRPIDANDIDIYDLKRSASIRHRIGMDGQEYPPAMMNNYSTQLDLDDPTGQNSELYSLADTQSTYTDCTTDHMQTYINGHHQDMHGAKRFRTIDSGYSGFGQTPDKMTPSPRSPVTKTPQKTWSQIHDDVAEGKLTVNNSNVTVVNAKGPDGMTPLMVAASQTYKSDKESDALIDNLTMKGADLNAVTEIREESALHLATRFARVKVVLKLLEAGADPTMQDADGNTPLHAAILANSVESVAILAKDKHTNVDAENNEQETPLIVAAKVGSGEIDVFEELLNAGASIAKHDYDGRTALHWAAVLNDDNIVQYLIERGANKDAQDSKDQTPLYLAARESNEKTVRMLLHHRANREITDQLDNSPEKVAMDRGNVPLAEMIRSFPGPYVQDASPYSDARSGASGTLPSKPTKPKAPRRTKSLKGDQPAQVAKKTSGKTVAALKDRHRNARSPAGDLSPQMAESPVFTHNTPSPQGMTGIAQGVVLGPSGYIHHSSPYDGRMSHNSAYSPQNSNYAATSPPNYATQQQMPSHGHNNYSYVPSDMYSMTANGVPYGHNPSYAQQHAGSTGFTSDQNAAFCQAASNYQVGGSQQQQQPHILPNNNQQQQHKLPPQSMMPVSPTHMMAMHNQAKRQQKQKVPQSMMQVPPPSVNYTHGGQYDPEALPYDYVDSAQARQMFMNHQNNYEMFNNTPPYDPKDPGSCYQDPYSNGLTNMGHIDPHILYPTPSPETASRPSPGQWNSGSSAGSPHTCWSINSPPQTLEHNSTSRQQQFNSPPAC